MPAPDLKIFAFRIVGIKAIVTNAWKCAISVVGIHARCCWQQSWANVFDEPHEAKHNLSVYT